MHMWAIEGATTTTSATASSNSLGEEAEEDAMVESCLVYCFCCVVRLWVGLFVLATGWGQELGNKRLRQEHVCKGRMANWFGLCGVDANLTAHHVVK